MLQELNSEMVVIYVTGLLQGVSFCQDPGMAFTEDQITECQNIMEQFIPLAMKALFSHSDPRQLCCFYFDGLCSWNEIEWIHIVKNFIFSLFILQL